MPRLTPQKMLEISPNYFRTETEYMPNITYTKTPVAVAPPQFETNAWFIQGENLGTQINDLVNYGWDQNSTPKFVSHAVNVFPSTANDLLNQFWFCPESDDGVIHQFRIYFPLHWAGKSFELTMVIEFGPFHDGIMGIIDVGSQMLARFSANGVIRTDAGGALVFHGEIKSTYDASNCLSNYYVFTNTCPDAGVVNPTVEMFINEITPIVNTNFTLPNLA